VPPRVVSSTIEQDTTWSPEDCPRLALDGNVQVKNGATLTVEADVEVVARAGAKLTVKENGGVLTADAGGAETISFVGARSAPGHWRAIEIESNDPDNVLDNVEVAHGGSGNWANVWVSEGARATVTNSLLRDSATHGIVVGADATFDGSDNVYRNNTDGERERR